MSTLRPSRPASAWGTALALAAVGLALPAPIASAAAPGTGSATVAVSAKDPAAAALGKAKVKVSAVRPASVKRSRWTMPVAGTPALDASSVDLSGRLKFARGKRNVTFTSLRLTLGKKPAVSGTVGKKRVTLLTLSGTAKRNPAARTIALKNAKTSLSPAAVRVLRTKLSTSRVKAGRLGKTTVAVRVAAPTPSPAVPTPEAPAPQPTVPAPTQPIDPGGLLPDPPVPPCWAATPTGSTDWIACDPATRGRLYTWINYIGAGGTTPTGVSLTGANVYDYRYPVASTDAHPDQTVTVTHTGGISFRKSYGPTVELYVAISNLRFDVAADRKSASVRVDASHNSMTDPSAPPEHKFNVVALTVDLSEAKPGEPDGGTGTKYELAPARLTAAGAAIWGPEYTDGTPFGAFTITVPDAG